MLRIPNPGSDLDSFVAIFKDLYDILGEVDDISLDDMTYALISRNQVTSQGAAGEEALRRSTRADRSRDPLYNQLKMYAECYRMLGWIHPTSKKLLFNFTLLGQYVAESEWPKDLVCESFLAAAYPNQVLEVKGNQSIRIFSSILLALDELETLSRDEMMAGPFSMEDDRSTQSWRAMIRFLNAARSKKNLLDRRLDSISEERGIKRKPTMENYTRLPLAFFPWSGYATKHRGRLAITDKGKLRADELRRSCDFRVSDFETISVKQQKALIKVGFYDLLSRASYDTGPVQGQRNRLAAGIGIKAGDVIFSAFSQLSRTSIGALHSDFLLVGSKSALEREVSKPSAHKASHQVAKVRFNLQEGEIPDLKKSELVSAVEGSLAASGGDAQVAAESLHGLYVDANQNEFYPLIGELFTILGLDCHVNRAGQNYARADAVIELGEDDSIPIEIKSPGEEREISIKAVRQALENKVIFLSRQPTPCKPATSTLVVGYNLPNERSEVHELIDDIHKAFDVSVGVIGLRTLLFLVCVSLQESASIELPDIVNLRGVYDV